MLSPAQLRGECVRSAPPDASWLMRQLYGTHDLEERAALLGRLGTTLDRAADTSTDPTVAAAWHAEAAVFALMADLCRADLVAHATGGRRG